MTPTDQDLSAQADEASRALLESLPTLTHRGIIVQAPPGAGKTTLVTHAADTLTQTSGPCAIVAQTNTQADHLVQRFAHHPHRLTTGRLTGTEYNVPTDLQEHPRVRIATRIEDLERTTDVIVATAMKWATVTGRRWPWAVVDEAYQMRSDMLLHTAGLFDQTLFVGDPGQLAPFSTAETDSYTHLPNDPMASAVSALLTYNPDVPVHHLPVSWRLPPSAAPLISDAFYTRPFHAGSSDNDRTLTFTITGMHTLTDQTIEHAARTGWALLELPPRITHHLDNQAHQTIIDIAERLILRGALTTCEANPQGHLLQPADIAIGTTHRRQAQHIRTLVSRHHPRLHGITVDTANRLQGIERKVTLFLHPLSGRDSASAFHLETGRLCVLTSRHRHACIVVARAGIPELLDAHPSIDPAYPGPGTTSPDGWQAHHTVHKHLAHHTIRA
ncbi:AAA domain-containing protein [Streptomyces cinereoruber]|uniref:Helicase n=1 Tax=Streptomyces cinereoruber TaxID=67260 RepID=A0ABX6B6I7_9ACTN|nr:AAA domain-containing protein [Streptomyces cinereoruber]MBB4161651.1 energy-coupling factor transporter ATP-binding protein EcfA2 [Streptomyces cinereoruber]MBY8820435.1 AAA family ATPase [Streptomyces cinereoruber]QEV30911.1 helicase [Streptomyces cinereoruber]